MKPSKTFIKNIGTALLIGCSVAHSNAVSLAQIENKLPTAMAQTVAAINNKDGMITLAGADADGDPLTFSVVSQPSHGTLTGTAPTLTYTPVDYHGSDSFIFKVNDGKADSAPATVSINVALSPGKTLHFWWGDFNTNDYNPSNSRRVIIDPKTKEAKPNLDYIDPDGNNTPEPPSGEGYLIDDKVSNTRRKISVWIYHFPRENDPMQKVGGVGGANRTVSWEPQKASANSPSYREVWGYFAEPDISGVNFDRKTNKPTYYFGVLGTLATDCGIQWEPEVFNDDGTLKADEGWTLVNRITTPIGAISTKPIGAVATDTRVKKGKWEIFGQFKMPGETFAHRFKAGSLRTVHMGYMLDPSNVGTISLSNGSSLAIQYCSPQQPVTVTSLRRNVGLTQGVTAEELASDSNAQQMSNALVYLDGSVLKGLKFGGGELKTVAPSKPTDPAQITTPWGGNNNELKPPDRVDDKFIVDFTEISGSRPLTKPRNPAQDWLTNYQTNFRTEDVIITMGERKKPHKIERVPKESKS